MLVLSRRKNESIVVGDNVQITISDVCGGMVKLTVAAPSWIPVHRQEVHEQIYGEKLVLAAGSFECGY